MHKRSDLNSIQVFVQCKTRRSSSTRLEGSHNRKGISRAIKSSSISVGRPTHIELEIAIYNDNLDEYSHFYLASCTTQVGRLVTFEMLLSKMSEIESDAPNLSCLSLIELEHIPLDCVYFRECTDLC